MHIKKMPTKKQLQSVLDDIEANYRNLSRTPTQGVPREYVAFNRGVAVTYFEIVLQLKKMVNPEIFDDEEE